MFICWLFLDITDCGSFSLFWWLFSFLIFLDGSFSSLLSFSPFLNVIARRGSFLLGAFFQPGKLRLFHLFRIASKKVLKQLKREQEQWHSFNRVAKGSFPEC